MIQKFFTRRKFGVNTEKEIYIPKGNKTVQPEVVAEEVEEKKPTRKKKIVAEDITNNNEE